MNIKSLSRTKMLYDLLIIPYRDQYFIDQYGWTVRDLMMIKALSKSDRIRKITVINRPVSIYERLTTKKKIKKYKDGKIKFLDTTSFDLIGPFQNRGWTEYCYNNIIKNTAESIEFQSSTKLIILDFTPIAKIDYSLFKNALIWYDLIDNFIKHNRFSKRQQRLVKKKYRAIETDASLITGVTSVALEQFNHTNKITITNGLLSHSKEESNRSCPTFAFGFVGFITDKLDVEFLINLANASSERIAIFGQAYDDKIVRILKGVPNIQMFGRFNESQLYEIISKFEIGLIPYREEKSHDGSPIKLYQYINYGVPVISTQNYEDRLIQNKYVRFIQPNDPESALHFLQHIRKERKDDSLLFQNKVSRQIDNSILWSTKIDTILNKFDILQQLRE